MKMKETKLPILDGHYYALSFKHIWVVPAVVVRVVDGDTVVVHMEVIPGFVLHEAHVRVQGINSPEMNTPEGKAAKLAADVYLPVNSVIKLTMEDTDKYGRMLAKVTTADGRSFGDIMVASGHAVVYNP